MLKRCLPALTACIFILGILVSKGLYAKPADEIKSVKCGVLIAGGGAGGTAAGIQSARSGVKTIIVEQTPWLGGMLTAAGVSATDGNHRLPSGLWNEFRESLYKHYGGPEGVHTGWVSYTLFEPHVGDSIFKAMTAKEKNLQVIYNHRFLHVLKTGIRITGAVFVNDKNEKLEVHAKIVIDATELGDVLKDAGAGYDVGMESKTQTGEDCALDTAYGIIQDITFAAIVKDYGKGTDKTIPRPATYDPKVFYKSCKCAEFPNAEFDCPSMIEYGRLPNNKFMLNWNDHGNDYYVNSIEMTYEERNKVYQLAKEKTLCYIYYIQNQLGFKNIGIDEEEFPTKDHFPFIPYHREGRRVKGLYRFTVNDILHPYSQPEKIFRTSISVGDYPIDQHIAENFKIPPRDFPRIPSFGIPLACLIPAGVEGLIIAEKGISVSNIVNGATRLQPCVMLTGQCAGLVAAFCSSNNIQPKDVDVRLIQNKLLDYGAYLYPFIDVDPNDIHFKSIQKIGVTGILQGFGVPYSWANQMWFYPERPISQYELMQGLKSYYKVFDKYEEATGDDLTLNVLLKYMQLAGKNITADLIKNDWQSFGFNKTFNVEAFLTRRMTAVLIDNYLKPFDIPVDMLGRLK